MAEIDRVRTIVTQGEGNSFTWTSAQMLNWAKALVCVVALATPPMDNIVLLRPFISAIERALGLASNHATTQHANIDQAIEICVLMEYQLHCLAEQVMHIEGMCLETALSPSLITLQNFVMTSTQGDILLPQGTSSLIAEKLRRMMTPETLNTTVDLTWIFRDFCGIVNLSPALSDMTLSVCRFGDGLIDAHNMLSTIWTWIALPSTWATEIASGAKFVIGKRLPCNQINFCLSPLAAIYKLWHWCRQGCFDEAEMRLPWALMVLKPLRAECSGEAKRPSGMGGQRHWHNASYIGSSWATIVGNVGKDSAEEIDFYQLIQPQIDSLMLFQGTCAVEQLCCILEQHCYSGAYPKALFHRHVIVPTWAASCMPFTLSALDHNRAEIEWPRHGTLADDDDSKIEKHIQVIAPKGIDVVVRRS